MRHIPEYPRPSWWVTSSSIYYGTFFPPWNGAFECKPSLSHFLCRAQPVWGTLVSPRPDSQRTGSCLPCKLQPQLVSSPAGVSTSPRETAYFPCIPTCTYSFEAGYPMLGLISLLLNQGQSSTRLWQGQSHSAELQLSGAFSKSFMKLFIL